ncbi:hypothetical protein NQZ71_25595 (plasmid) [Niallia taxi]|uniref:hypothetical protein n=1 Tax=Niallia taxi TaxID=2499688 RepID=UPI002934C20E|nr:hypothetical protein [Niallia taxi]WOD65266.1 hypothetical protein NQZ71_25595 [Niallia taxi]
MLDKIKSLPAKLAFSIGLTLIIGSPLLLFLFSSLFSIGTWTIMIVQGIIFCIALLFIVSAADKRHS